MKNRMLWIIVGVAAIVAMLMGGLLPLPGQRDNVTSHTQPSPPGQSPQPKAPRGPAHDQPQNPLTGK
jgi:hypothetical protein